MQNLEHRKRYCSPYPGRARLRGSFSMVSVTVLRSDNANPTTLWNEIDVTGATRPRPLWPHPNALKATSHSCSPRLNLAWPQLLLSSPGRAWNTSAIISLVISSYISWNLTVRLARRVHPLRKHKRRLLHPVFAHKLSIAACIEFWCTYLRVDLVSISNHVAYLHSRGQRKTLLHMSVASTAELKITAYIAGRI